MMLLLCLAIFLVVVVIWWKWREIQTKHGGPPCPPGWLPVVGHLHLLGNLPHKSFFRMSQKYGHLVMLYLGSKPTLVASSSAAAKELLCTNDMAFASRPKFIAPKYMFYGARDIGWSEYGAYWRHLRKVCTLELFTTKRMDESSSIRSQEVMLLLKAIENQGKKGTRAVNLNRLLSITSMNMLTVMAFRMRLDSSSDTAQTLVALVQEMLTLVGVIHIGDYIPLLTWMDPYRGRMKRVHRELDKVFQIILDEHRRSTGSAMAPDLMDVMLSSEMDEDTIKAVILDVIAGGIDTSSVTVEWALSELMKNPECMLKAQEELDRVVGREGLISEADLSKLDYLTAVIKETFRLHPALPLLIPHESTSPCIVLGYRIPANTRLLVNAWCIGRDQEVWGPSASQFQPERFVGCSVDTNGQYYELLPFGSGRRMCPAMSLGLCMVKYMLAQLVQLYDWRCEDEKIDMEEAPGLILRKKVPLVAFAWMCSNCVVRLAFHQLQQTTKPPALALVSREITSFLYR